MSQITICLLCLAGLFLLPLIAACIVCWASEAFRLFHYAIKTRTFDDIAGFCVFMAVSLGLMAGIAQIASYYLFGGS